METIPPRTAGDNRKYPTDAERKMRRSRRQRAAELLVEGIAAAGQHKPIDESHRIRFLYFATGQNRDQIAAGAAELVILIAGADNRSIGPAQAERFIWHHLHKHFGWQDVADLEPAGFA